MVDELEVLKQLQNIDGQLYHLRREKQQAPQQLEQAQVVLTNRQTQLKAAEENVKSLQMTQKEKEIELQTREANVKKLQGQMFQVKTNKEYTAMQHEIDTLKADNSLLEEEIIALLDQVEEASRMRQEEQKRLTEAQAAFEDERRRIQRLTDQLDTQIKQLEESRQQLLPKVPPVTLELYQRVLLNREGLALAPLVDESCGGCHRRLPPQVINEVYIGNRLVSCESCNRILYAHTLDGPQ